MNGRAQHSQGRGEEGIGAATLSVVIVTWQSASHLEKALAALGRELRSGDELIVVDNASTDGSADKAARLAPDARVIRNPENTGFTGGVNRGAEAASGDLLVLLNPDAEVQPGWRKGIAQPTDQGYGWGAWQALITSDDGTTINSDGNEIHYTGICWAGQAGRPIGLAAPGPKEAGYASGACLAIPLRLWRQIGGFPKRLFMYGDDTDISLRVRLLGHKVGMEPAARVEHSYEFDKGSAKWRYLERSRWAFIIRNYPGPLLAAVFPGLALTEVALIPVAARGGWLKQKLLANLDLLRWLPGLLRERRAIQRNRRITAAEFADALTAELDSDFLGGPANSAIVRRAVRAYWRLARSLIGRRNRRQHDSTGDCPL